VIGGSLYLLVPNEVLKTFSIPLENDFIVLTSILPYNPVKKRLLESFKAAKLPVKVVLKNGSEHTGAVGEINHANVVIIPTNENGKGGLFTLASITSIEVNGEIINV